MAADFKSLGKNEQGALIAGVVALVFSFFSRFIKVSIDGGKSVPGLSFSGGESAWHSWGLLGILLVIVATAVVALKAFARETLPDGVPWSLVALGAAGLGTIILILRPLLVGGGGTGISVGPGWSAFIVWIAALALTWFTFNLFQASGEKMPDMNKNSTPPAPPAA
jgi:hypothetical protein